MFKHIVVGCDGSPEGRDAVALGAAMPQTGGVAETLVRDASSSILIVPRPARTRRSARPRRAHRPAFA